jgi:hypothetical protein
VNGNAHTSISVVDFRATRSLTRMWAVCRLTGNYAGCWRNIAITLISLPNVVSKAPIPLCILTRYYGGQFQILLTSF